MNDRTTEVSDTDATSNFIYSPLSAPDSLRLLQVHPEKIDNSIQVQLWETTESISYDCLSYTWGDQAERVSILVNGRYMRIGKNLYTFLEVAQYRYPGKTLWIDAICINQADDSEKSSQVQRMGSIFAEATEVLVWLGNEQKFADLFEWLNEPQNMVYKALEHIPIKKTQKHLSKTVVELSDHSYWTRAWVTQEFMLARSLRLLCGTSETSPKALAKCIGPFWSGSLTARGSIYKFRKFVNFLQKAGQWQMPVDFFTLLAERNDTECADRRDRIYSLLAVTGHDTTFKVDYSESIVDLYWRAQSHFSAWSNFFNIMRLWNGLGLDAEVLQGSHKVKGDLRIVVPMRQAQLLRSFKRQIGIGVCSNGMYDFARSQVKRYSSEDIILCSAIGHAAAYRNSIHIIIQRSAGAANMFSLFLHTHYHGRMSCPPDTELWHKEINGQEQRLGTWSDVAKKACKPNLVQRSNNWTSVPQFLVHFSHQFVIDCVQLQRKQMWEKKIVGAA